MKADSPIVSSEAIWSVLPRLVAEGRTPEDRPASHEEHEKRLAETAAEMGGSAPVARIFLGYIGIVYLLPFSENGYLWANAMNLNEAGLSVEETHRLALANLDRLPLDSLGLNRIERTFGYFQSNFASSLLLLDDEFWRRLDIDPIELVFACPLRDWLLFAPRSNHLRVCKIASMVADFWNDEENPGSHKLSDHLLQRDDRGSWSLIDVGPYLN